jgi:hypothetical protein
MALFHHRSLGQWKSISTRGALKLAAANIPFENSSTAFGALHPYGQSNILEIVNTTILVRKSTEKVFEQHRSVFFHKSSCILAIYKDIYIELTKISTAITTQKKGKEERYGIEILYLEYVPLFLINYLVLFPIILCTQFVSHIIGIVDVYVNTVFPSGYFYVVALLSSRPSVLEPNAVSQA